MVPNRMPTSPRFHRCATSSGRTESQQRKRPDCTLALSPKESLAAIQPPCGRSTSSREPGLEHGAITIADNVRPQSPDAKAVDQTITTALKKMGHSVEVRTAAQQQRKRHERDPMAAEALSEYP
jgi:hypothetical protein